MSQVDIREELRKKRYDRDRAEAIRHLVKQDGWTYFVELLNLHIADRTSRLLEPVEDGQALASEHNKGTVYGLIYARDLPSAIIASDNEASSSDPTEEELEDA